MARREKNANYDFAKQKEPSKRMGSGQFSNMPEKPIMRSYSSRCDMRDGIVNSFTTTLEELSGIPENER